MENGLLYVLAFSAMAIALFACILPNTLSYSIIEDLPSDETTYILRQDQNGNYWIENQEGTILYYSRNCSYTLTRAYDDIPTGGLIVVSASTKPYYLNVPVASASKAVLLKGVSISYKEDYGISSVFYANGTSGYMFDLSGQWSSINQIVLHGNSTGMGGIRLNNIDSYIDNCFILFCTNATYPAITLTYTNHWVRNCWIEWNNVAIASSSTVEIANCHFVENGQDISFASYYDLKVESCLFRGSSTRAINFWGTPSSDIIIANNIFETSTYTITEFILISGTKTLNSTIISDNIVKGNAKCSYFVNAGNSATLNSIMITDNVVRTLSSTIIRNGTGLTGNFTAYNNIIDGTFTP